MRPAIAALILTLALCLATGAKVRAATPGAGSDSEVSEAVRAELDLQRILERGDEAELLAFYHDSTRPGPHRARTLRAVFDAKAGPLPSGERLVLIEALKDPAPAVRIAACQIVGALREQVLARQVLEMAADDPDEQVRLAALLGARPWTRLTHLYFLEAALSSKAENVRAEAIRSIAILKMREVSPALMERVSSLVGGENPPQVRRAALDALNGWNRLDWEMLRNVVADSTAPTGLRIYALQLSDKLADAVKLRTPALIDMMESETSVTIGWHIFSRLKSVARSNRKFVTGLSKLLDNATVNNAATDDMAGYLRSTGYNVTFEEGAWKVTARRP